MRIVTMADVDDDCAELQTSELEALRSMFTEDELRASGSLSALTFRLVWHLVIAFLLFFP